MLRIMILMSCCHEIIEVYQATEFEMIRSKDGIF